MTQISHILSAMCCKLTGLLTINVILFFHITQIFQLELMLNSQSVWFEKAFLQSKKFKTTEWLMGDFLLQTKSLHWGDESESCSVITSRSQWNLSECTAWIDSYVGEGSLLSSCLHFQFQRQGSYWASCTLSSPVLRFAHLFCLRLVWHVRADRGHVGTQIWKTSDVKLQALCVFRGCRLGVEQVGITYTQKQVNSVFVFCQPAGPITLRAVWCLQCLKASDNLSESAQKVFSILFLMYRLSSSW